MDNTKIRLMGVVVAILIALFSLVFVIWLWLGLKPHLVAGYKSDLSGHTVEVWVYKEFFSTPGDAGSGRGFALLKDSAGEILERKETELVISIDKPRWYAERVEIPLFAEWSLSGK